MIELGKRRKAKRAEAEVIARPAGKARFFYVDVENVHSHGFDQVRELGSNDTVFPMYTDKACKLDIGVVGDVSASEARVMPVHVLNGGANYADFQIAVFAALNAERMGPDCEHVIVSDDHGFDKAIDMAARLGVTNITRRATLLAGPRGKEKDGRAEKAACAGKQAGGDAGDPVVKGLRDLGVSAKRAAEVAEDLRASDDKHSFYTALVKRYGAQSGLSVYNAAKKGFSELKAAGR